jgi:hypothetical protein
MAVWFMAGRKEKSRAAFLAAARLRPLRLLPLDQEGRLELAFLHVLAVGHGAHGQAEAARLKAGRDLGDDDPGSRAQAGSGA